MGQHGALALAAALLDAAAARDRVRAGDLALRLARAIVGSPSVVLADEVLLGGPRAGRAAVELAALVLDGVAEARAAAAPVA